MIMFRKLGAQPQEGAPCDAVPVADKRMLLILGLTCCLALVWPLPHSIALRNILMVILLSVLIPRTQWTRLGELVAGPARAITSLYMLFTLWILVVAFFISPFPHWSLSEITGQWFSAAVALALGALTAKQAGDRLGPAAVIGLLGILSIQVLAVDVQGLWMLLHGGDWTHMARLGGLTAGPGKASYLTNFLLSALIAELSLRMEGQRALRLAPGALWGLLGACLLSIYFEAMRNELFDVGIFMLFVGFIGYRKYSRTAPGRALFVASVSLIVIIGASALDVVLDPRWSSLWATIPIALDTKQHLAWLNGRIFPLPHLPNGQIVSASNYLRIAWIKEGLRAIAAHPLGVGFGRSAFGHALRLKYGSLVGDTGLNNSLITIGIGTGIPGLALWLAWFFSMGKLAIHNFSGHGAFYARFWLLIILSFGIRMAMDNDMQNYTLEQFLYFIGLLCPLASGVVRRKAA